AFSISEQIFIVIYLFKCSDSKAGPNIRNRIPEMISHMRLLWARFHHRLAFFWRPRIKKMERLISVVVVAFRRSCRVIARIHRERENPGL
ncbi:MAG: hypothetical protein WCC77_07545, partial [Pseudolabrys sp.]